MTDDRALYQSSIVRGSYFNRMLDCGPYDRWVEIALGYLPRDVLDEHKEDLAFISMAHRDGCRLSRVLCETREIILLSDHVLPKGRSDEGQPDVRYFIYVVLHEVAHATKKHKSPQYDSLTQEEFEAQEEEADALAFQWFNDHISLLENPHLPAITSEEIEQAQVKSQETMKALLNGA
ncbi:MAG: hypothetical protein IPL03_00170 [Sterolibacteriaceae bacterium]|nr:hypothetical protein [Candidatus Methylophosphatis haderslevensis]